MIIDLIYQHHRNSGNVVHMGGCQNHGPLLGPLNTRGRTILRTPKGAKALEGPTPVATDSASVHHDMGDSIRKLCMYINVYTCVHTYVCKIFGLYIL